MDKHIIVFGTSITQGLWDLEGGWVARLRKHLDKKTAQEGFRNEILIFNQGISGAKSGDILKIFRNETEARLGHNLDNEIIIILDIGINDTIYSGSLRSQEVSLGQFEENLKAIISQAKTFSKKVIVLNPTPVDKRVDPIPWAPGRLYRNEIIKNYSEVVRKIASEEKTYFIEVFDNLLKTDYSKLLSDGVHLNNQGHEKLFETVRDFLIKEKII